MFRQKKFSQYKATSKLKKSNKLLQLTALVIGFVLINNPAIARKQMPNATANNVAVQDQANTKQEKFNTKEDDCLGQVTSPAKLVIPVGKSTLITLPEPLANRSVGNPNVVQSKLISPKTLYLLGVNIGTTNMIIRSIKGACTVIDVTVNMDPDALRETLTALLPNEKDIIVTAAADSLILSGTVEDAITANRVVEIAEAYVRRQAAESAQKFGADTPSGAAGATVVSFSQGQNAQSAQGVAGRSPRVVNLLGVGAQQQVMLEVKIAEVSKTLLDKLGIDLVAGKINGNSTFFYNILPNILPSLITPTPNGIVNPRFADNFNLGATTGSNDSFRSLLVDAEKRDGLVKILAEPSIMAISGQEGSFLAGGTIFIPVAQNNNNGIPTITLEEKEFGIGVKFTPTVLAGGRINLRVSPEVSDLNREGIGITATGISGTAILPSFTTRRASTTVQLLDGQSFAIGGLIKNNTTASIKAFPILGEIPIIGALFRSTDFQKDKTELIFVVTPHLVKPLATNQTVRLPTDRFVDPSRVDIFLNGKLEGKLSPDSPAPVSVQNKADALKSNVPAQPNDTGFDVR